MTDPCRTRFTTWIDQKIGGAMLGEVVVATEHDAALAQLAALREELEACRPSKVALSLRLKNHDLQQRIADAEQRNADLIKRLQEVIKDRGDSEAEYVLTQISRALTKPTESGASE